MPKTTRETAWLTVRVDHALLQRLKYAAVDHDTTQRALVHQALTEYLDRLTRSTNT